MATPSLPVTKLLTFFSEAKQSATPPPFTKAEILAFPEVKFWLAKGYDLETFENKLSPKDPHQIILLVVLAQRPESGQ